MTEPLFEPGSAGWEARMLPLCYVLQVNKCSSMDAAEVAKMFCQLATVRVTQLTPVVRKTDATSQAH